MLDIFCCSASNLDKNGWAESYGTINPGTPRKTKMIAQPGQTSPDRMLCFQPWQTCLRWMLWQNMFWAAMKAPKAYSTLRTSRTMPRTTSFGSSQTFGWGNILLGLPIFRVARKLILANLTCWMILVELASHFWSAVFCCAARCSRTAKNKARGTAPDPPDFWKVGGSLEWLTHLLKGGSVGKTLFLRPTHPFAFPKSQF